MVTAENGVAAHILKQIGTLICFYRFKNAHMDGVELFERAREINADIEAVIISAYSDVKGSKSNCLSI